VNQTLSDPARGGFYASQDADYSLEDDGDYFTWTLDELRGVLDAQEARVMELFYDVEAHGEMHHNPAKNVLWIAREPGEIAHQLAQTEADVRVVIARAKQKMLAARAARPTPFVDESLYVSWNAMFVSAYLDAARVLGRADCRDFALKTLDRMAREAWLEEKGFAHRFGSPGGASPLEGTLEDQVFAIAALLDAYEATLDPRWLDHADRAAQVALRRYFDAEAGGFFDRASDAPPLGGLEMRRKPFQDSPTPSANAAAAAVLSRLFGLTGNALYQERAQQTLEAFAAAVPQYGLFAASYGLAASLYARGTIQVVVTGAAGDPLAEQLAQAAQGAYRFGKSVLRITPEIAAEALAPALRQTIPHLDATKPQALVCVETTCRPPITDPVQLAATLAAVAGESGAVAS